MGVFVQSESDKMEMARVVHPWAIGFVFIGTFIGVLFGSVRVLPALYQEFPNVAVFLYVLMFYGYINVTSLWFLLRMINPETPMTEKTSPPSDQADEPGDGDSDTKDDSHDTNDDVPVCSRCQHLRLPRSHHCGACDVCVDVHDHHCLFAGRCIGKNNQKHFLIYCLWYSIGLVISATALLIYFGNRWQDLDVRWFDLFCIASAVIRLLVGDLYWENFFLLGLLQVTCCTAMGAIIFLSNQLYRVFNNKTAFELGHQQQCRSGMYDAALKLSGAGGEGDTETTAAKPQVSLRAYADRLRNVLGERHWLMHTVAPITMLVSLDVSTPVYPWRRLFY